MARRIVLRPEVPDDLRDIVAYLEGASTSAADRFVESVFAALDDLAAMPGLGSPKRFRVAGITGVRSWWVPAFKKYLIFYQVTDEAIIVLAVVHGARNIRKLLRNRRRT